MAVSFDELVKLQGRYFPREVRAVEGAREIIEAHAYTIEGLKASDPALLPDPAAKTVDDPKPGMPVVEGKPVHRVSPYYPPELKAAGIEGEVVLQATVAKDGKVRGVRVVVTPNAALGEAAADGVKHWTYAPSTQDGKPVEVKVLCRVIFSLRP